MNDASILPSSPLSLTNEPIRALNTDRHLNNPDSGLDTDYEAVTLVDDAKTFVTTSERLSDDDSYDDDVSPQDELDDNSDGGHVPAEVNVSYDSDEDSFGDAEDDDTSSEASEEDDDDEFEESDYESESSEEEDGNLTERDNDSCYSSRTDSERRHELFLPLDTSPTFEKLKYDTEDEDSDDDEEEMASMTMTYRHDLTTGHRGFRPRRMMMLMPPKRLYERHASPSNISLSSSSSNDSSSIRSHDSKQSNSASRRPCVSFDNTVAVYPVFETDVYSPSMIQNMYTNREELRVNKLRNKREFAYDDHDWRNATEECDMQSDEDGELVHPVHTAKRTFTRGPFLSNASASIWQPTGAGVVHRAKRMRMYYP
eukprot:CCRYP_004955-RA/>CCRYP_004955-RA protein AED:0.44 eAED:0.44 QI:0/-1/0/1/-1/1/1/0/369